MTNLSNSGESLENTRNKRCGVYLLTRIEPPSRLLSRLVNRFQEGQFDIVLEEIRGLRVRYPLSILLINIEGSAYAKVKRYQEALDRFYELLKIRPDDVQAFNNIGNVYSEQGHNHEAIDAYDKALLLRPDFAEASYNKGNAYQKLGELEQALKAYKTAIFHNPKYAQAFYNLGVVHQKLGDPTAATKSYKKCLNINPNYSEALNNMGNALVEAGETARAISYYEKLIKLRPDYGEAFNNLGIALCKKGDVAAALDSFKQAIILSPDNIEILMSLGKCLKTNGQDDEAAAYFEYAALLDENDTVGAKLHLASMSKITVPSRTPWAFLESFYKTRANNWDHQSHKKYRGHLLIKDAFRKSVSKKTEAILDLGCGTGSLATFIRPKTKLLVGIDISPDMLALARDRSVYDVLYQEDLEEHLSRTSLTYDIIVASAVFVHFLELKSIFYLVRNSLKISGKLIFTVFESDQGHSCLNDFLMYSHHQQEIDTILAQTGFEICIKHRAVHEYHDQVPVNALVYVVQKTQKSLVRELVKTF